MKTIYLIILSILFLNVTDITAQPKLSGKLATATGMIDAASFGFSAGATGVNNVKALQEALDQGGTIVISKPGIYKISGTAYIGDNTSLICGAGVIIQKSAENGPFTHVLLNKGALTRTYNYNISITGLTLDVNGVDKRMDEIYGLRGHIAFFYVKDLKIERLRCTGLINGQFCLHICTFEDLIIDDVIIKGKKDGIHLGKGKRFKISNAVFQTGDDAIALVPGDWVTANPEFGNLEDGVIENCSDIPDDYLEGAFAKIVAAAWIDWKPGMKVRHGDAVVSAGKIYRVLAALDDQQHQSFTRPAFEKGQMILDGINWLMFQNDTIHTAVVRNVTFRNIYLHSIRIPFQLMSYSNKWAHSYYPGAQMPIQGAIFLDNINVLTDTKRPLISISTPCDFLSIQNTTFRNNNIEFTHAADYVSYPETHLSLINCVFKNKGRLTLITNQSPGKEIYLNMIGSTEMEKDFSAGVDAGPGVIHVNADLTGLKK